MILIKVVIIRIQTSIFTVILLQCGLLLFIDPKNRTRFLQTFPYAGYYEITPPGSPDDKILILNSVLFSVKAKGPDIAAAAAQELAWLKQVLSEASANHQRIWLVFHISMGIDVYKTILSGATTWLW